MDSICIPLKLCARCGIEKPQAAFSKKAASPDGLKTLCKSCVSIAGKLHYARNRDRIIVAQKAYRDANPEKMAEKAKRWAAANPEKTKANTAKYRQRHPDRIKAYAESHREQTALRSRKWAIENPDKSRAKVARYHKRNPEKGVIYRRKNRAKLDAKIAEWRAKNLEHVAVGNHKNRARRRSADGGHSRQEIRDLLLKQSNLCANPYCRVGLLSTPKALDHIVAMVKGGSNGIENLQWLCRPCNARKGVIDIEDWLVREKRLSDLTIEE